MEKLAAKYEGAIDIVKVDVDANPGLSRAFNIMSIPTIAFFASIPQGVAVIAAAAGTDVPKTHIAVPQTAKDERVIRVTIVRIADEEGPRRP